MPSSKDRAYSTAPGTCTGLISGQNGHLCIIWCLHTPQYTKCVTTGLSKSRKHTSIHTEGDKYKSVTFNGLAKQLCTRIARPTVDVHRSRGESDMEFSENSRFPPQRLSDEFVIPLR